MKFDIGELY